MKLDRGSDWSAGGEKSALGKMVNPNAPTYLILCRRSDGKLEVTSGGKRETNAPTPAQLEQKPNDKGERDFYREIGYDEAKHLDWRRKLGRMMLMYEGKPENKQDLAVLEWLPQHYRLFEHVKMRAPGRNQNGQISNHAGGGPELERQDAYLYGHPGGRRKRFRSPADFFPHLIWLCTDESGDKNNCRCKFCSPEELQAAAPSNPAKSTKSPTTGSPVTKRAESETSSRAETSNKQPQLPQTPANGHLPVVPRSAADVDRHVDLHTSHFLFRQGEMVWYPNPDGRTYGIGMVVRRWLRQARPNDQHLTPTYTVQPFSSPLRYLEPINFTGEFGLRPWLMLIPPQYSSDALNKYPVFFHQILMPEFENGLFGSQSIDTDSSVLAARSVDMVGTPFQKTFEDEALDGQNVLITRHYNGLYFGAEKIWVGDVVRFHGGNIADVLLITNVVERQMYDARIAPDQRRPDNAVVKGIAVVGDVYRFIYGIGAQSLPPLDAALPGRLGEDLRVRNEVFERTGKPCSTWMRIKTGEIVKALEIKGRWYEPSLVLPSLDPAFWQAFMNGQVAQTELVGKPVLLSRGCPPTRQGPAEHMWYNSDGSTREWDVDRAVPPAMRLVEGIDPVVRPTPSGGPAAHGQTQQQRERLQRQPATQLPAQHDDDLQLVSHGSEGMPYTQQQEETPFHPQQHEELMEDFMNWPAAGTEEEPASGFPQEFGDTGGGRQGGPYY